ncbi:MAG: hypothetical protein A2516_00745 [Alphaproteobacteria bacterium RIFOXYD12_FULL_60_8]|nr:MAG: hypothetical protein A2516_00745 [Alphaproteobacteria bacterium RIFOXYD12_FULL_60_8]
MPSVRYTRRARNDVDEIIEYIAHDNPSAAETFFHRLVGKFYDLAQSPLMGREHTEFGAEVRLLPFGNYIIFYRPETSGVIIVRVLHGARHLPAAFNSEG